MGRWATYKNRHAYNSMTTNFLSLCMLTGISKTTGIANSAISLTTSSTQTIAIRAFCKMCQHAQHRRGLGLNVH